MKNPDVLKLMKANRYTYYNIHKKDIKAFQKLYKHTKNIDRPFSSFSIVLALEMLNNKNYIEYVRKYKALEILNN